MLPDTSRKSASDTVADVPLETLKQSVEETGLFDTAWYQQQNPDVKKSGVDGLTHYITSGEAEGRYPNLYFDPAFYRDQLEEGEQSEALLLLDYANRGWKKALAPSAGFSAGLYIENNADVRDAKIEPLKHFLHYGQHEGRTRFFADEIHEDDDVLLQMRAIAATQLFLGDWYLSQNFDIYGHGIDPLEHYVVAGSVEGRRANPFFDTGWYRKAYKDVIGDEHPLLFWAAKGYKLGHDPAPDFASDVYFLENPDLKQGDVDPLLHYLSYGRFEGRGRPDPKNRGSKGAEVQAEKGVRLPVEETLRGLVEYPRNPLKPTNNSFNPDCLNIHWIIPDFAAGGGGHMTIFRMVHFLELRGHKQTVWIHNPRLHDTEEAAFDTILKHFQHFTGDVFFADERLEDASGDVIIASDCFSVWPALCPTDFKRRFYFVQDHEPSFHPVGSYSLAAEMSYKEDLDCICASPWLEELMREKHGKWARYFWLAADTKIYMPPSEPRHNEKPRIAVYARTFTARRLVELSFLGLEVLARRGVDFHVDFFGADLPFNTAPFSFTNYGVAKPATLAKIFQTADIGVVFSATNYSLVPQEMMACGLPIIEFDGENTRAIFNENIVTFTSADPLDIADTLEDLINDPDRREIQSERALDWVRQYSWPMSAKMVEKHIIERLTSFASPQRSAPAILSEKPKASVVIPTLNPGPLFQKVLKAVLRQKTPDQFDVLVIDSGSTDGTVELLEDLDGVRLHQIDKADFNHGDTRNLGVEMTDGEYVAFLTHDALPFDDSWLYNLVSGMDRFPDAGGVFGKHVAWPTASAYTKRDLEAHFDLFNSVPLYLDQDTDPARFKTRDPQWMQTLHFYSDNNSMLRRSVWEKVPMRRTQFGEDHLYAYDIIMAGYGKLYMPQAIVYHSHDYDAAETRARCGIESAFFKHFFGYRLMETEEQLKHALQNMNENDERWGRVRGLSDDQIALQKDLNKARLLGHMDGCLRDTDGEFE